MTSNSATQFIRKLFVPDNWIKHIPIRILFLSACALLLLLAVNLSARTHAKSDIDTPAATLADTPTATPTSWPATDPQTVPRNIIIMVGDGMGFSHVDAASMYKYGETGAMAFEYAPYSAEMTTFAADNEITDSAASASAMATGFKTNNRVISLQIPGDGSEQETSLEYYRDRCKATGLVTTSSITHATPASFAAHEALRYSFSQIAEDYFTQTRPNILFGGTETGVTASIAAAAGYQVATTRADMQGISAPSNPAEELFVSGQFDFGHLEYEFDYAAGVSDFYDTYPHLSEMAVTALDLLEDSPDGFFLVIEGARIDHAGHSNLIKHNVFETIEFENTFIEVLKWMEGRDDTLLILTADHETGGLSIDQNEGQYKFPQVSWDSRSHTDENVPVYAWGPNAQMVAGIIDNTDIYDISIAGSEPDALVCPQTVAPTPVPTEAPTLAPTAEPTLIPIDTPTLAPTVEPTTEATIEPTSVPTEVPTSVPTLAPTDAPTSVPTEEPTIGPTDAPTSVPTEEATPVPTEVQTVVPTVSPTREATDVPTLAPTEEPTLVPTDSSTDTPVDEPTTEATLVPTEEPTVIATVVQAETPAATELPVPFETETPSPVATSTSSPSETDSPTPNSSTPNSSTPEITETPVPDSTPGTLVSPVPDQNGITMDVQLVGKIPIITWTAVADGKTEWFNVLRASVPNLGRAELLTTQPILALDHDTNVYTFEDPTESTAAEYYYWLEQKLVDGQSILYGPQLLVMGAVEETESGSLYLPLIHGN